jgi:hypothetical protein
LRLKTVIASEPVAPIAAPAYWARRESAAWNKSEARIIGL